MQLLNELAVDCGLCVDGTDAPSAAASGRKGKQQHSFRVVVLVKGSGRNPAGGSDGVVCDVVGGAPSKKESRHVAAAMALEMLLARHPEAAYLAAAEARGDHHARRGGGGGQMKRHGSGGSAAVRIDPDEPIAARFISAGLQVDADGAAISGPHGGPSATVRGGIGGQHMGGNAWPDAPHLGASTHMPKYPVEELPLTTDNKGYGLLKKAGWQEGSGLGLHGQGASLFLAPASQRHIRGLGFQKGEAGAKRKGKAAFGSSAKKKQRR